MRIISGIIVAALVAGLAGCADPVPDELVVYSSRKDYLIEPLLAAYSQETGIPVRLVSGSALPLLARLQAEGSSTEADLLVTVDATNLWQAAQWELLQPVQSVVLDANVPESLRDPHNRWFALSLRARTIVYARDRVDPGELSSYAALADPQWRRRLCLRSSRKVYNRALVATMIERLGEPKTEAILRGWVRNLAAEVFSNDTAVLAAILAGQCDVAIVNSYYYARLKRENPQLPLGIFWPNQDREGVHMNIAGAGIPRYAPHPEQARDLLEWLTRPRAQRMLAEQDMEFPVNAGVLPAEEVQSWGDFKADAVRAAVMGGLQPRAQALIDRAGYR